MMRPLVPSLLVLLVAWSGSPSATPRLREPILCPTTTTDSDQSSEGWEGLLRRDPTSALQLALRDYRRNVRSASFTCTKQERIGGKLQAEEEIDVLIREQPYAVRMAWRRGGRVVAGSAVQGLLYVSGENGGRMTVWRPQALVSFLRFHDLSPTDAVARQSSRYSPTEAGLGHTLERTVRAWSAAQLAGRLDVEFLGRQTVAACGGKQCFVLKRTCREPERDPFLTSETTPPSDEDGARLITIYLDIENGRQLGAELLRADGALLGSYHFTNVVWNPKPTATAFSRASF